MLYDITGNNLVHNTLQFFWTAANVIISKALPVPSHAKHMCTGQVWLSMPFLAFAAHCYSSPLPMLRYAAADLKY